MSQTQPSLKDVSEWMRDIDFAMLTTRTENGHMAARPMSNNGDVEYDGDSYYFAWSHSRMVKDIQSTPQVGLTFQGRKGLLGKPPLFIGVEGEAHIVIDKNTFAAHWTSDLDRWFQRGVDTPGLVMLKISAKRIHYWNGEDQGEVAV